MPWKISRHIRPIVSVLVARTVRQFSVGASAIPCHLHRSLCPRLGEHSLLAETTKIIGVPEWTSHIDGHAFRRDHRRSAFKGDNRTQSRLDINVYIQIYKRKWHAWNTHETLYLTIFINRNAPTMAVPIRMPYYKPHFTAPKPNSYNKVYICIIKYIYLLYVLNSTTQFLNEHNIL